MKDARGNRMARGRRAAGGLEGAAAPACASSGSPKASADGARPLPDARCCARPPPASVSAITRTGGVLADRLLPALDSAVAQTGLLKHTSLDDGEAMIIAPTNAVHTWFMKFDIDIAFVTRDGRVVKTRAGVQPWRMTAALRGYRGDRDAARAASPRRHRAGRRPRSRPPVLGRVSRSSRADWLKPARLRRRSPNRLSAPRSSSSVTSSPSRSCRCRVASTKCSVPCTTFLSRRTAAIASSMRQIGDGRQRTELGDETRRAPAGRRCDSAPRAAARSAAPSMP